MGADFGSMISVLEGLHWLSREILISLSKKFIMHQIYATFFAGDQEYKDEQDEWENSGSHLTTSSHYYTQHDRSRSNSMNISVGSERRK